jgi:hypothetical protein
MKILIHHGDIHLLDVRTRIPFKYGIATMTEAPHAFVRLLVEFEGRRSVGVAADVLPPKWFTKIPDKLLAAEVAEMLRVIEHALQLATGLRAESAFDAWRQLDAAQASWGRQEALPPLLTNFGTSLVERALLEAVCRAIGRPLASLLRSNQLAVHLGDVHEALRGQAPGDLLPESPCSQISARHTVGLADPIVDTDIEAAERLDDGLPHSLAACIRAYGLRHFKIKVSGTVDRDAERLRRIAEVVDGHARRDFAFSLDGNEQFRSLPEFRDYWNAIGRRVGLQRFLEHLLFVEQPFHRDVALEPSAVGTLKEWPERPPLIIDESDAELDSLPRALELGYAGTSHKNCKGVFKGIANACLLAQRRREPRLGPALLSGEDLANIGPVALLQDLAACAALGIESVERNGHHYFAGLSMFPHGVQKQVLESHGDLYRPSRDGWPTLAVTDGKVSLDSVNRAPFGVGFALDVEQFTPLAVWRRANSNGA